MSGIRLLIVSLLAVGGFRAGAATNLSSGPDSTVVIANKNVPASIELAMHYVAVRGIPTNHVCVLDLPTGETIARRMYEQRFRDPLLAFLRDHEFIEQVKRSEDDVGMHDSGWRTTRQRVRYLVSMYGVPLRVAETRPFLVERIQRLIEKPFEREGAAVDSELACVLWESHPLKGYVANPFYNDLSINRYERQSHPVLIAARLDGPDEDTVRRMIDDAIATESNGLSGRAYIDARSVQDADYQLGDFWLTEAAFRLSRYGFDVMQDRSEAMFPAHYPMQDAAVYFGWYSAEVIGPFLQESFRFRPGAVAYHIYSGSAKTLRAPGVSWVSALLSSGAAAVMGAVDEPYLGYTPDLQIFTDRLLSGYTFGESAYLAQRALSWQITIVGDPLYRPFANRSGDITRRREASADPDVAWEHLRRMNLLADQHQFNIALNYGREALKKNDSLIIREKLADMYAKNELWGDAIREYRAVIDGADNDLTAIRVGYRLIMLLRFMKNADAAAEIEAGIRKAWPESAYLTYLGGATP